jgi:thioredoxin-related protein
MKQKLLLILISHFAIGFSCAEVKAQAYLTPPHEVKYGTANVTNPMELKQWLQKIPADDRNKFFVTLFTSPNCLACTELKQAFETDPWLKNLKEWSHFNVYDASNRSQDFRRKMFSVQSYPTIVIQSPNTYKYGAGIVILRETGFDGDANELSKRAVNALGTFLKRKQIPCPLPVNPKPVTPNVLPQVPFLPLIPNIPPVQPDEEDDAEEENESEQPEVHSEIPKYPEIVLIVDPDSIGEEVQVAILKRVVARIQKRLGNDVKMRVADFVEKNPYQIQRDQTPAIIYSKDHRIVAHLSGGLLDVLTENEQAESSEMSWWSLIHQDFTLDSLFTSDLSWPLVLLGIAIYFLRAYLRRNPISKGETVDNELVIQKASEILKQADDALAEHFSEANSIDKIRTKMNRRSESQIKQAIHKGTLEK